LKNLAEATSEAQDTVALPTAPPKALGAGCAMNLFFNKLSGVRFISKWNLYRSVSYDGEWIFTKQGGESSDGRGCTH
jgi:hypothetical protein